MSLISDFKFERMSRIGNDSCDLSQRNVQNVKGSNYTLTNHNVGDCFMSKSIDVATSQPNVFYKGTHQMGLGGCNVDVNSDLSIGKIQTHPKCKLSLYQRPFLTIPYLGKGPHNPVLESKMVQGESAINRKSVNPLSERSYQPYMTTPMLPTLEATVSNPANLVEGVAAEGWIRGGLPSRELAKDQDYFRK